jgi:16S rRNA (guanine527-N7)-methyltransferase
MSSPEVLQLQEILSQSGLFRDRKLSASQLERLSNYYRLILKWNERLHLTTIIEPPAFAERHLFESFLAERQLLPQIRRVWDFGSGLGIPGIPIALLRPDLSIVLVEASKKKALFLKEALYELDLPNAAVLNRRFELIGEVGPQCCITARALDRMSQAIPKMLEAGKDCAQFLLFGGAEARSALARHLPAQWTITPRLIPRSRNRFLISLERST